MPFIPVLSFMLCFFSFCMLLHIVGLAKNVLFQNIKLSAKVTFEMVCLLWKDYLPLVLCKNPLCISHVCLVLNVNHTNAKAWLMWCLNVMALIVLLINRRQLVVKVKFAVNVKSVSVSVKDCAIIISFEINKFIKWITGSTSLNRDVILSIYLFGGFLAVEIRSSSSYWIISSNKNLKENVC